MTLTENSSVITNDNQGIRSIHTTRNSCRKACTCTNMTLKLPQYFCLLMEKSLNRYFQDWSPYFQAVQCNQTPILLSSKSYCAPSPFSSGGGGVEPSTKFSKGGELDRTSTFKGRLLEKRE